jgi:hypothetical protein
LGNRSAGTCQLLTLRLFFNADTVTCSQEAGGTEMAAQGEFM